MRGSPVKHPPFADCLDALQVSKTLTALAAALTTLDVPYRDDWHEWIEQLVIKYAAQRRETP